MVVNELFVDLFFLPVRREAFHLVFDVTFIFYLTTQTPTRCLFFHTILCLLSPQKNDRNDDGSWKIGFSDAKANRERTLSRVVFTTTVDEEELYRRVFSRQTFISQFSDSRNSQRTKEHVTILRYFLFTFFISFSGRRDSTKLCITGLIIFPEKFLSKSLRIIFYSSMFLLDVLLFFFFLFSSFFENNPISTISIRL